MSFWAFLSLESLRTHCCFSQGYCLFFLSPPRVLVGRIYPPSLPGTSYLPQAYPSTPTLGQKCRLFLQTQVLSLLSEGRLGKIISKHMAMGERVCVL